MVDVVVEVDELVLVVVVLVDELVEVVVVVEVDVVVVLVLVVIWGTNISISCPTFSSVAFQVTVIAEGAPPILSAT